jgi:hypothetical protein
MTGFKYFLEELAAEPRMTKPAVAAVADAIDSLDRAADRSPFAAALVAAMSAACRLPIPLMVKLHILHKLVSIRGDITIPRWMLKGG